MMTDNDLCASMRGAESWWSCPFASILWPGRSMFEFWTAAVNFPSTWGENTPHLRRLVVSDGTRQLVRRFDLARFKFRRIGSILWTIWDAVIISVQEIFSFNVLHFARSYQLKSPVIITRFPSISQVFLPIVPTRRPGWQLASGCCYCYYTPDNDSTHTHTLLAAQKSRLFLCVLARTTHFPASGKSSRSRLLAAHRTGWDLWRGWLRELHLAVEQLGRVHKLPPRVAIFRKFFAPHF